MEARVGSLGNVLRLACCNDCSALQCSSLVNVSTLIYEPISRPTPSLSCEILSPARQPCEVARLALLRGMWPRIGGKPQHTSA